MGVSRYLMYQTGLFFGRPHTLRLLMEGVSKCCDAVGVEPSNSGFHTKFDGKGKRRRSWGQEEEAANALLLSVCKVRNFPC